MFKRGHWGDKASSQRTDFLFPFFITFIYILWVIDNEPEVNLLGTQNDVRREDLRNLNHPKYLSDRS